MVPDVEVAASPGAVAELRRRAERLAEARHPGVVELLGATESEGALEVRTAPAEGTPLAQAVLDHDELAGVVAAVATTLADLHDRGVVHGALTAEAVVVGSDGCPVLHDLAADVAGIVSADDVAALGILLDGLATDGPLADVAAWARQPDPARRPSARALAAAVAARVPGARLPGAPAGPTAATPSLASLLPAPPRRVLRPGRLLLAVVLAGVLTAAGLWLATPSAGPSTGPSSGAGTDRRAAEVTPPTTVTTRRVAGSSSTTAALPVAVWPPATVVHDGRLFAVGQRDDVVVVADWGCTGTTAAAVLRPATGEIWLFDGWVDAGEEATAVPAGRVEGGVSAVAADGDGDGCTDLVVTDASGGTSVVHPGRAP